MKVRREMRKERFLGDFEEMGVRKCEGRVEMKKGERERERSGFWGKGQRRKRKMGFQRIQR